MDIHNLDESVLTSEGANILERATVRMLFSNTNAVFFAYFIVKMSVKEEPHPPSSLGMGMSVADGIFTLSWDGVRLKESGIDDIESVCWVEGHECMHWVLNHHWREREYWQQDEELIRKWHLPFNICADLELHNHYPPQGKLIGKVCQCGVDGPYKDYPVDGTMEEFFEKWRRENPEPQPQGGGQGQGQEGEGDGEPGPGQSSAGTKPGRYTTTVQGSQVTVRDNQTGQVYKFKVNDGGVPQRDAQEDLNREVLRQALSESLKEARPSMGTEAGEFVSLIERMRAPALINWWHRFRMLVGKYVRFSWHGSWRRFSRRLGEGFRGRVKDHGLRFVICRDTSGSVTDEELAEMGNEIENIRRVHKVKSVWVVECDAKVQAVYELKPGDKFPDRAPGRGGTDFRPAFEYVEAAKLQFDMMIWLTDSQGQWPERKPNYPIIWAVTRESALAAIPWGDVVFMHVDKKPVVHN